MDSFASRVQRLPLLGIGVSTEYGSADAAGALDTARLAAVYPQYAAFLEVGVEVERGLDRATEAWIAAGRATTYHFLDVNLDDPADLDARWLDEVRALVVRTRPE